MLSGYTRTVSPRKIHFDRNRTTSTSATVSLFHSIYLLSVWLLAHIDSLPIFRRFGKLRFHFTSSACSFHFTIYEPHTNSADDEGDHMPAASASSSYSTDSPTDHIFSNLVAQRHLAF